jgi:hypothetical protein
MTVVSIEPCVVACLGSSVALVGRLLNDRLPRDATKPRVTFDGRIVRQETKSRCCIRDDARLTKGFPKLKTLVSLTLHVETLC